jgi:hypothetical protein
MKASATNFFIQPSETIGEVIGPLALLEVFLPPVIGIKSSCKIRKTCLIYSAWSRGSPETTIRD